jgi:hypothetical protein
MGSVEEIVAQFIHKPKNNKRRTIWRIHPSRMI